MRSPQSRPFGLLAAALPALLACGLATPVAGQDSDATPPSDDSRITAPTRRVVIPDDVDRGGRPPLLREGGFLVKVEGEIERDAELGVHVYRPLATATGGIRRELILLPSRGLDDLVRLESVQPASARGNPTAGIYEVTGKVLVFQGRNFLLPGAIVPVRRTDEDATGNETIDQTVPAAATSETATDPDGSDPLEERDYASEIESRLESRIGAVPRSLDVLAAPPTEPAALKAGTRFVQRRGRVVRDPASGIWRFVLEGTGRQGGGSSVQLLPCLELERLIRRTRQAGVGSAVLLSGVVTMYQGRNYLLPTAVRTPTEGRSIGP